MRTSPRRGHSRRRVLLIGPVAIGLALVMGGCGGGSAKVASVGTTATAVPATAASGGASPGGALVEYARCMRSHGVSHFPEPGSLGAPGSIRDFKGEIARAVGPLASSAKFQQAQRACVQYYGPPATSPPPVSAQQMRKLLAVSRCMRAHGVADFPDPGPTTGEMNTPAAIDRSSPTVLAALRACSPLAQAAGLGPPNTGQ